MDIQVSSNFERLLFELYDREGAAVGALMEELATGGGFDAARRARSTGCAPSSTARGASRGRRQRAAIAAACRETGEVICPHTAVGVHAARARRGDPAVPMVVLATAHPAKFPDAVEAAMRRHGRRCRRAWPT